MQAFLNLQKVRNSSKVLLFLLLGIIAYIAFLPNYEKLPEFVSISGVINHFMAFLVLSFLLDNGFEINKKKAFLFLFIYGFFIEFVQYFLPNRAFELLDLLVDMSGVFVFYFLLKKKFTFLSTQVR